MLPNFVCLIGLNGSGKSSILQAFDFLSQIVNEDENIETWLERRRWVMGDLKSKFSRGKTINFRLVFEFEPGDEIAWEDTYNTDLKRCTSEQIFNFKNDDLLLIFQRQKLYIRQVNSVMKTYDLQGIKHTGSVLSFIQEQSKHKQTTVVHLKNFMLQSKS